MDDLIIRREGQAGHMTLNRPKALNALTHAMVKAMSNTLRQWSSDPTVKLVIVDSVPGKAFCAGGDLRSLYDLGPDDLEPARRFWADEYRLNAQIARYPKPYVAIMNGIVMGGGVGISAHGSHRIVTENTVLAMPEVTIGFMPDVGGTWLLARAPAKSGAYLGLTGRNIGAADAIYAGFADRFVPAASLSALIDSLAQSGDTDTKVARFARSPGAAPLATQAHTMATVFSQTTVPACVDALELVNSDWSREARNAILANSPFSVCCAFEAIKRAASAASLEDCLTLEYRFACRSLRHSDFREGIRAAIIDRDRKPRWTPSTLQGVAPSSVAAMLSSLGPDEMQL